MSNHESNGRNRMKTIRGRFRAAVLMGAVALVSVFAAGARAQNAWQDRQPNDNTWPYASTGRSPVLAVVGDIACQPGEVEVYDRGGDE